MVHDVAWRGIGPCHAQARTSAETDWSRIAALYDALTTSPGVELNRAVAIGMAFGPEAGSTFGGRATQQLADDPHAAQASMSGPARPPTLVFGRGSCLFEDAYAGLEVEVQHHLPHRHRHLPRAARVEAPAVPQRQLRPTDASRRSILHR